MGLDISKPQLSISKTLSVSLLRNREVLFLWASQVALAAKNLPAYAGDLRGMGVIPGQEDPLRKEVATHSSILVWRIP